MKLIYQKLVVLILFVTNSLMGAIKVTEIDKIKFNKENVVFDKIVKLLE